MLPAFKDGDRIIIDITFSEVKRGDVIVFYTNADRDKVYFKRVIGLPGETVTFVKGDVYIDGKKIEEPYLDQNFNQMKDDRMPKSVPDRSYFVLGDNRDNSSDSRSWGVVAEDLIIGKHSITY